MNSYHKYTKNKFNGNEWNITQAVGVALKCLLEYLELLLHEISKTNSI